MRKVSIIVPVYNVECYLEQCLESALAQTMREIEIICINDGSTDGSLPILKRIAHRDSRVRIVDKPNSGYGKAMNIGIDLARGKYLFFWKVMILFCRNYVKRYMNYVRSMHWI